MSSENGDEEMFAPIAGFPGYFVGDRGSVLSVRQGKLRQLRPMVKSNGYHSFNLSRGVSGVKTLTVHPLVAAAFIGPRPNGHLVLHWDGSRTNNDVRNLRWGTHVDNAHDAFRHGTIQPAKPAKPAVRRMPVTNCPQGHPYDEINTYRQPDGKRKCRECRRQRSLLASRALRAANIRQASAA